MKRIQAFEFHERHECPKFLRDSVVEILGHGMRLSSCVYSSVELFKKFYDYSNSDKILDICSGSGEPASALISGLKKHGIYNIKFIISDLFPKIDAMENVKKNHPQHVEIITESVDATNVPKFDNIKSRTIINAFHHFKPDIAQKIIEDCVKKRHSIFIFEAFPRDLLRFFSILPASAIGYLINPFITKENKILKVIFSYIIPIIPLLGLYDGIISVLRIHNKEELMEMVKNSSQDYDWQYHEIPFFPFGKSVVFFGICKNKQI